MKQIGIFLGLKGIEIFLLTWPIQQLGKAMVWAGRKINFPDIEYFPDTTLWFWYWLTGFITVLLVAIISTIIWNVLQLNWEMAKSLNKGERT